MGVRKEKEMKKYPVFNKYFNRTPKGFALFFFIFYILTCATTVLASIFVPEIPIMIKIVSIAWNLLIIWWLFNIYSSQITLKKARIGKHLKKTHGVEGDELVAMLDSIEAEMNKPLYADATNKRRYNAFFVTENWLVGTDGIMLVRANACKRSDIKTIEKNVLTRYRKGITYYYYVLQVTDKNDHIYQFWLRSQENVDMAYDFLMNDQKEA